MKVLLVSFFNDEAYGVRSIHSNLIKNGVDTYMLFFKLSNKPKETTARDEFVVDLENASNEEVELLVSHIKENKYDIVGFSLVSQNFNLYKKIYGRIKDITNMSVVIGGWQVSLNPDECINYTDFLCIGEGEDPMCELVEKIDKRDSTYNIENFWIRLDNGIFKNPVRPLRRDLSSLPVPLFDHKYSYVIDNNEIKNEDPYYYNDRYGTFISRGCPYKCTYCSNSYMAKKVYPFQWSKSRQRSMDHVKEELLSVKDKLNVESINFYDEVFTPKLEWISDFFGWYKEEIKIPFYVFFYPGMCNDEKAKILANSGLAGVWLGVQSGSEKIRKEIFKRFYTNKCILEQANIFYKYGISVKYDFIFDNPFETFEESVESICLMLELPRPCSVNLFSLKYFPNTEITEMAKKRGFITNLELCDNYKKDYDTYSIHQNRGNLDNRFVNHLAFYISNILDKPITCSKKDEILGLIGDYRISKDIEPVKLLVKPYLDNKL